jgi:2-dehydropantoate 2-reductase
LGIYRPGNQIVVRANARRLAMTVFAHLVQVCDSVISAADQAYDYVLLTTKAIPDVMKTSDILSPLLTAPYTDKFAQPTYVLLQNGLNVELDLYHSLRTISSSQHSIISTAVWIGTNLLSPNVVEHNDFVSHISPSIIWPKL